MTAPSPFLTAAHERLRDEVRAVLDAEVAPFVAEWEDARGVPRTLWPALARHGLLGLHRPADVGGRGLDLFSSVVFLEELGRAGTGGVRAAVAVHAYMATHYLTAPEDLAAAVAGEKVVGLAVTEPGAGSDLAGLSTSAVRDGDGYVVRGEKHMVSNGTTADLLVVAVRTSAAGERRPAGATGLSLLAVDTGLPGVVVRPEPTAGWRAAGTATVVLDGVRVPADRLLGRPDSGFYQLMRGFQLERLVAAVLAVGGMDGGLDELRRHLRDRRVGDAPLASRQAVRHRLADLATTVEAARHLVHHAAWRYERDGDLAATACTMAKLFATEAACRLADESLQLHGSHGFLACASAARAHRDARAATIAAGPSEVMRDLVAAALLSPAG